MIASFNETPDDLMEDPELEIPAQVGMIIEEKENPPPSIASLQSDIKFSHSTKFSVNYVASRGWGIIADCCANENVVWTKPWNYPEKDFENIPEKSIVWVRYQWIADFMQKSLPSLKYPIILLSSDEDVEPPGGNGGPQTGTKITRELEEKLLQDPNIKAWYVQNYCPVKTMNQGCHIDDAKANFPKLHPIPIGLDFHTGYLRRMWGLNHISPRDQEMFLLKFQQVSMNANKERELKVFIKWGGVVGIPERPVAMRKIKNNLDESMRIIHMDPISREEQWKLQTKYAFVLSPRGHGLDTHRTWESLLLRNIIITKTSSLDSLYAGLPVVIVQDWDEVTADNVRKWFPKYSKLADAPDLFERLTMEWWIRKIKNENGW